MKITGPGQIQSTSIKKSAKKQVAGSDSFAQSIGGEKTETTTNVSGSNRLTPLNTLLALQEVPDSTDGRSKGLSRANDMLDLLEEVRRGILLGSISTAGLKSLADLARNHRQNDASELKSDEKLNDILLDIELRAEVELAKLGL
ncbi:flagellar assembly protein FliX [Kordiimonas aquimaris]|uniref:flagellar assembly protein FliX n=1 Tax=Kordiimonas aquimaris TaxID=707591 RepID=UPI0021CEA82F|nr:flagellar assembly protein FliX [Kordiimonas aquimaris]